MVMAGDNGTPRTPRPRFLLLPPPNFVLSDTWVVLKDRIAT